MPYHQQEEYINNEHEEMPNLQQEGNHEVVVVGRVPNMDEMVTIIEYIERLDGNPLLPP